MDTFPKWLSIFSRIMIEALWILKLCKFYHLNLKFAILLWLVALCIDVYENSIPNIPRSAHTMQFCKTYNYWKSTTDSCQKSAKAKIILSLILWQLHAYTINYSMWAGPCVLWHEQRWSHEEMSWRAKRGGENENLRGSYCFSNTAPSTWQLASSMCQIISNRNRGKHQQTWQQIASGGF